jgi:beta-galactosidase/beta-glucuronidase
MRRVVVVALLCCLAVHARADDWKPARGPLLTQWARNVKADKVHPEYPRPQLVRETWQNLNGLWQFAEAKEGDKPPVGKKLDGQILVPFPVESALSGVMKPIRRLWYRRTFTVPKEWADDRVLLHFGAVNWESTVWLNGKELTTHKGGYDPFTIDLTDHLKKGGEQELIVGVHNPVDAGTQPRGKQVLRPGGIYYTPSTGIWQTVWLEPVPKASIESITVVPDVANFRVTFTAKVRGEAKGLWLDWTPTAPPQKDKRDLMSGTSTPGKSVTVKIPLPLLWSPEKPSLYGLSVSLRDRNGVVDSVTSYFAFREVKLARDDDGFTRIFLNGKPYFQVGLLDQGFWPDGLYAAPTDAALKYDVEMTKKLGFNLIRKHVKVEPARWYHHCDRLGVVVWQDMPSGDKDVPQGKGEMKRSKESAAQYELELKRMIENLSNHPCVIAWVPFNEGWGQFDTKRIAELVKKIDPTRLVNSASGWNDVSAGDVHDVHVYPGPGAPKPEKERASVLGEFGGLGLKVDKHVWTDRTWGYLGARDKADLTRRYERLLRECYVLKQKSGLSAVVYTQTTDVEAEANGLLTYDRAVVKADADRVAAANRGDFSRVPQLRPLVATSERDGLTWRYTLEKPAAGWMKSDFDDGKWKEGKGGFGTKGTPGAVVRTEWKTKDIWLRREFTLPEKVPPEVLLRMHYDEDAEVYVNGVLALKTYGFLSAYEEFPMEPAALKALKPGKNVFAVHCKQTTGGQYVDVGLVEVVPLKKK